MDDFTIINLQDLTTATNLTVDDLLAIGQGSNALAKAKISQVGALLGVSASVVVGNKDIEPTVPSFAFAEAGTYTEWGNVEITGDLGILIYDGVSFSKTEINFIASGVVEEDNPNAVSGGEVFEKTATLTHGKNYVNKDSLKDGFYINELTGQIQPNASYKATEDFIKIEENTLYIGDKIIRLSYYSEANEGSFISGIVSLFLTPTEFTTPSGANYIRVCTDTGFDLMYLGLESEYTGFEPYEKVIKESTPASSVTDKAKENINYDVAKVIEVYGKNRIDNNALTLGYFVNAFTGELNANASYKATDFCYVGDLENYTVSPDIIHIAKYSEPNEESFIGGEENPVSDVVTRGVENWVRLSFFIAQNNLQLESGSIPTEYEVFSKTLKLQQKDKFYDLYESNDNNNVLITLPNNIYLAPNIEYNFYFKNIFIEDYGFKSISSIDISSYQGNFMSESFLVKGDETGSFGCQFKSLSNGIISSEKQSIFNIANINSGNGINRKVLFLGDSTINQEWVVDHVYDYFQTDVMDVTFIGTRQTAKGVKHEGRSGWKIEDYYNKSTFGGILNPFYNPSTENFDLSYYMAQTSQTIGNNDWFFIQLGINDLYSVAVNKNLTDAQSIVDLMITYLEYIVNSIKSYNSNIKIGIGITTPPSYQQNATGLLLDSALYNKDAYEKIGLKLWWETLLSYFQPQTNVYLVPINSVLDTVNNFQTNGHTKFLTSGVSVLPAVNDVYSINGNEFKITNVGSGYLASKQNWDIPKQGTLTKVSGSGDSSINYYNIDFQNLDGELMQVDDVHPSPKGYFQMADVYSGIIKYFG